MDYEKQTFVDGDILTAEQLNHMERGIAKMAAIVSNPNLLDNWYFADPINQRGQTEYVGTGYTIDRWKAMNRLNMTISADGMNLNAEGGGFFAQQLEPDLKRFLVGKTCTLSALMSDGTVWSDTHVFGVESIIVNIPSDSGDLMVYNNPEDAAVNIRCGNDSQVFVAVKLELGSQQTLARQENGVWVLNDPPPNKQQELAKCQRYCYVPTYGGEEDKSQIFLGVGLVRNAETADINIPLPCAMRAAPSLTYNNLKLFNGISVFDVLSLNNYSQYKSLNNTNLMVIASSGGLTTGDVIELFTGDANSYLIISADL